MPNVGITFLQGLHEGAKDAITRYHETGDLADFDLIEGDSGHGWVYRLRGLPYVMKVYKPAALNNQDHYILQYLLNCPYAPQLYAYVDNKFVVMEYIEGISIQEYLDEFQSLPKDFYHHLRLALYEIAWSAKFILADMKVESSVIINRDTGNIKIIDYGVGDDVGDFPESVALNMAHNRFLDFLALMGSYQLFTNRPKAEEDYSEALITQEKTGSVEYFESTECRDMKLVFEQQEELKRREKGI